MKTYIRSALVYHGGKYRLLPQIEPLFPKNIDTFYDVFGGSATVTVNANAKKYVYNELNEITFGIIEMLKQTNITEIFQFIFEQIDAHKLPNISTDRRNPNTPLTVIEYYKQNYYKYRAFVNENAKNFSNLLYYKHLFNLHLYSFHNKIQFDKHGNFVSSRAENGSGWLSPVVATKISNFCEKLSKLDITMTNSSFETIDVAKIKQTDFVYLDPPYSNTNAVYNKQWNDVQDAKLIDFVESLMRNGIKFGLSNVTNYNGATNKILQDFINANKNKLQIYEPTIKYTCATKQTKSVEVYITNCSKIADFELF